MRCYFWPSLAGLTVKLFWVYRVAVDRPPGWNGIFWYDPQGSKCNATWISWLKRLMIGNRHAVPYAESTRECRNSCGLDHWSGRGKQVSQFIRWPDNVLFEEGDLWDSHKGQQLFFADNSGWTNIDIGFRLTNLYLTWNPKFFATDISKQEHGLKKYEDTKRSMWKI